MSDRSRGGAVVVDFGIGKFKDDGVSAGCDAIEVAGVDERA